MTTDQNQMNTSGLGLSWIKVIPQTQNINPISGSGYTVRIEFYSNGDNFSHGYEYDSQKEIAALNKFLRETTGFMVG